MVNAILCTGTTDLAGDGFQIGRGVAHGNAVTDSLKHFYIVVAVTESHCILGRQAVKAENFPEYCRQNGLFFLKAGFIMALIGALDALVTLSGLLYVLLYLFGLAFAFYPLTRWCKENEGFSWPWPRVESEKKRIKKLRRQQEAEKAEREEK